MFNMSKKAFWVPYNEGDIYPTVVKAHQAISKYCDENGDSYTFTGDDEVVINDILFGSGETNLQVSGVRDQI